MTKVNKTDIPCISFVGRSKTGKTTVIEQLIPVLRERGFRVAVIKHHPHDFEIDKPGKDTYRYKQAGAVMSILVSPYKVAVVKDSETRLNLRDIIARYVHDVDLLIIEGFKRENIPKIEVYERKQGEESPVCWGDKNLIALISDYPVATGLPLFSRNDIDGVVEFVLRYLRDQQAS